MSKYLFFLIIFLIPLPLAYAEVGKNFDTVSLDNGLTQWTSHYDRIFDGDSWENYLISNNSINLEFESANLSFVFDKVSCDFKLLDPESQTVAINGYDFTLNIDGLPTILPICNLESFTQSDDKISFTINRGLFKTLYEMNPTGSMEWTHEIDNNEGKASTFTIIETCTDCIVQSIDGDKIDFGSYTLDTKNDIHGTVKETKADKGDYVIEFEKIINDKEKLIIDPTFTSNNPTVDGFIQDTTDDNDCLDGSVKNTGDPQLYPHSYAAASPNDCIVGFVQWDLSSIPTVSTVPDSTFTFDISQVSNPGNCDYTPMTVDVTIATNNQIIADIMDGTPYSSNNSICTTTGNDKVVDLGASGDADLLANINSNDRFTLGLRLTTFTHGASDISSRHASEDDAGAVPKPTLTIVYTELAGINDLVATDIRGTSVDLDWTQPGLGGGELQGYQINSTTPWSNNVASVSLNFTNTTSATVNGLLGETQYSFRIGVWDQGGGINPNGNVLNITTDLDPTSSFTPGTFNLTGSGTDVRDIKYVRDDIDATTLLLNITADNDFELACNFHYKFANTNNTYTSIANTSINANEDMASFQFNNVNNEIIDVLCWDQYTNASARYVITITDFPLLDQITNFRSGVYGTSGNFGALDLITLLVVIISFVGFNRVDETVGIIFGLFVVGGLAVLSVGEIITWETTYTAGFALLIMFGIAIVRKG